jgi:hypothetical protein
MKNYSATISRIKTFCVIFLLAVLTYSCQPANSSTSDQGTEVAVGPNLEAIMAPFAPKAQTFNVSSKKPSVVTGKAGTKIHVQPKNLTMPDGSPVKGDIQVNLIECTKKSELLSAGLQTVSDGKLLESGGSYYLDMKADGQALKIKDGATVQVEFPKVSNQDMELFYGNKNAQGQMNWDAAKVEFEEQPEAAGFGDLFADSSSYTMETDTIYAYISGIDTVQSDNIEDIFAYMESEKSGNESPMTQKEKNEQARQKRKANAERDAASKQQLATTQRNNQEQSRVARANAVNNPLPAKPTYLGVNLDRFGWYNCDRFMMEENTLQFAVQLPKTEEAGIVYLVVKSRNSIIQLPYAAGEAQILTAMMPANAMIEVLMVEGEDKDGTMIFAKNTAKVEQDKIVEMQPKPTKTKQVKLAFANV